MPDPRKNTEGIEYFAVDLLKGEGIDPALAGVETVLHLAGGTRATTRSPRTWSTPRSAPASSTWYTSR
ncbi:hypothetical protein NKH18_02310 [Streptomyces sp. M10(2022)]